MTDLFRFETLDSTNDEARRQLSQGCTPPFGVVSVQQRQGRGRQGRSWVSPHGTGVYLTHVESTQRLPKPLTLAPLAIGCGVADWLNGLGLNVRLKWPNDLRIAGAKIGGILCELYGDALLVGVGINWFEAPAIADQPTTAVVDHRPDVVGLSDAQEGLHGSVVSVLIWWKQRGNDALRERWWGLSEKVSLSSGSIVGHPMGLADDGALLLRDADGAVHTIRAGDVEEVV